ncbi:MAG: glycosyltransferase family 39 protein [Anaerolinea sp.]|nr:glycosyltransferase family 39 protein [Anaerolinea sp.]
MQNTNRKTPVHQWIVICLALFAFGMSAYLSRTVFERLPHLEDEVAYLFQARVYAHGDVVIPSPELRRAFWQPFVVDRDGLRFSKYTPGWSAQLAVGVLLGETWVINAFYAALTVAVTYRLGREIFNPETGVIAAALFAFSPMALLLNATLMGHTSALFWTTLFLYAYWRLERGRRALWWGALAGIALGILIASRPLTGLAVALPVIVWSVIRLVRAVAEGVKRRTEVKGLRTEKNSVAAIEIEDSERLSLSPQSSVLSPFLLTLTPLLVLGVITILISLSVPLYNHAAVGDPFANLYRLVWDYDRIGFGTGYGRNGHTLQKAYNHSRFDLSLTAADLFGWQIGTITDENGNVEPEIVTQLTTEADYWLRTGVSWVLIPFGLIVAFRRRTLAVFAWFAVLYAWIRFAPEFQGGAQMTNPYFAWIWVFAAFAWVLAPFLVMRDRRTVWSWILVAVTLSVLGFQLTYWIGSQRYSTRYYYEALTAVCIISALPVAWLIRARTGQRAAMEVQNEAEAKLLLSPQSSVLSSLIALAFAALLLYSLFAYSLPRIGVLRGFNNVNQSWIAQVEERAGNQPALVIINGSNVRWRAFGSLMASTSPYLDSPIIAAWNFNGSDATRERLLSLFPDRHVIDMDAEEAQATFRDTPVAQGQ